MASVLAIVSAELKHEHGFCNSTTKGRTMYLHRIFSSCLFIVLSGCLTRTNNENTSSEMSVTPDPAFHEFAEADEQEVIKKAVDLALGSIIKAQAKNGGITRRDAHPKAHGCVQGSLTVNNQTICEDS